MTQSFMLRKEYGEEIVILDLGYVSHPETQRVADLIRKVVGKKNMQLDSNGYLKADIINKKDKLFEMFEEIKVGAKCWHSDYHWEHKDDSPYDVKWHHENVAKYGKPALNTSNTLEEKE